MYLKAQWDDKLLFFDETTSLQSSAKYRVSSDTCTPGVIDATHVMKRFSRQMPPLGLYLLLVFFTLRELRQFQRVLAYQAAVVLLIKLLDAIQLPVKAVPGTDGTFTSSVHRT